MKVGVSILCIATWASGIGPYANGRGQPDPSPTLIPAVIKESMSIPEAELPDLIRRAKTKETEAALRLATYYGMYLGDTEKGIHYYEIAAANGSEKALYNLMMIFATISKSFDFDRALQTRTRLKAVVAAKGGKMESDGDWAYDMYIEHFVGYGNKRRGLSFLRYAAKQGSEKASAELAKLFAEDPELAK